MTRFSVHRVIASQSVLCKLSKRTSASPYLKSRVFSRNFQATTRDQQPLQKTKAQSSLQIGITSTLALATLCIYIGYQFSTPSQGPPASTQPLSSSSPKRQHDTRPSNLLASLQELKDIVGDAHVTVDEGELLSHSDSAWSTYQPGPDEKPYAVIYPSSTAQISETMKVCHRRKIPVTGYSGGTSTEGQYAPTFGGICIDFSRMDRILALHEKDLDVVVQPGLGWEVLNEELAKSNLFFPPDPGPGAQIGGMVGTGCSGTNAYRYGTMRDWVISLTVVLADGTVIKTRQRPRKSSAGYDLTKIFVGSEGTLGLVTEAVLKITPLPQSTAVAISSFPTLRDAVNCVGLVVADGVQVAAVEIMDEIQMQCINKSGITDRVWPDTATLFFKFSGTPRAIEEHIGIVKKMAMKTGGKTFEFANNEEEKKLLWSARKAALFSVMALKRSETDRVWTGDIAVPISRLPDIIEETKEDLNRSGLLTAIVGHVGDGNFHATILYNESQKDIVKAMIRRMVDRAVEMEGTVSGEHGVGVSKRDYLPLELGQTTVDLMRQMKLAFDPMCLLNCDKVVKIT